MSEGVKSDSCSECFYHCVIGINLGCTAEDHVPSDMCENGGHYSSEYIPVDPAQISMF